jgi:predicted dehydrogenase
MNVALIGTWHVHAEGYVKELCEDSRCKLTAVWDEDIEKAKVFAEKFGSTYCEDLDDMLNKEPIDGVIICSPTSEHEPLIIKAVSAGKHVFTEKVLSITLEEAKRIQSAVHESGIKFVISYPHKCRPELMVAKELVSTGFFGKITYARVRNSHNGSIADWLPSHFYDKNQCGGGAMIDLGAHPMYTLLWLLGKPVSVTSTFTSVTGREVEDNAVSVMTFADGAIGVSETGFVSNYNNYNLEINGVGGALRIINQDVEIISKATDNKWEPVGTLPKQPLSPLKQWISSVMEDTVAEEFGVEEAVQLTMLMEGAYQSYYKNSIKISV